MDKQIQKIKNYLDVYLGKNSEYLLQKWGLPDMYSDGEEIWFFNTKKHFIFRDEIAFFITNDLVTDIAITEYILGIPIRSILYFKEESPEFKIVPLLKHFLKSQQLALL